MSWGKREVRAAKPLDAARLEELALAYVARFATTRAKLVTYLNRKLFERGWVGEGEASVVALVERLCSVGYVDDAVYARAKSGSLMRRGFGKHRVSQALGAAEVDAELREELAPEEAEQRRAALILAKKRRFGPFDLAPYDRLRREKQIGAMLRAGHPITGARAVIDAASIADAEAWAYGADEDGEADEVER